MRPCEVRGPSVFVAANMALKLAVEELDVAFGEGVRSGWFVGACAPEGRWLVVLQWW